MGLDLIFDALLRVLRRWWRWRSRRGGCRRVSVAAAPAEAALVVRAQPAETRVFERRLTVQGTLEARRFVPVAARADGILEILGVDRGDPVVAGQTVLFPVDPASRANALTIAEQDLAVAEAAAQVARATREAARVEAGKVALDYARYERLRHDGRISAGEFEAAEVSRARAQSALAVADAQVNLAERQIKRAEAALEIARKNLEDTRAVAPISGRVSARLAEPGERVTAGRVVVRIEDLSEIEAVALLPAAYHGEVIPGVTKFRLTLDGRAAGEHAVTYRAPTIQPLLRTFEIRARLNHVAGEAVPGSTADLTLVFESRAGVGVPSLSVLSRGGSPTVFVVEKGRARARVVEPGLQNDGWTEIRAGLRPGELVVTEGQTQLFDDRPVEIQ